MKSRANSQKCFDSLVSRRNSREIIWSLPLFRRFSFRPRGGKRRTECTQMTQSLCWFRLFFAAEYQTENCSTQKLFQPSFCCRLHLFSYLQMQAFSRMKYFCFEWLQSKGCFYRIIRPSVPVLLLLTTIRGIRTSHSLVFSQSKVVSCLLWPTDGTIVSILFRS